MAGERDVLRNLSFALDGHPISAGANKFEVKIGRERLPWTCFEEPGRFSDKGDWEASVEHSGYGTEAEAKVMERLGRDEEDDTAFLLLLESDTKLSPHAAVGSAALFMTCRTFSVNLPSPAGKIREWSSSHSNSDGSRPYVGKTIYTNRAKTPAPLGAGVVTPAPVTFPALVAGYLGVFTVHATKITGTGTVTLLAEVLSDTAGFTTPLVRHTFPLFTNEDPPTGGNILGPKSQTVVLDGDVTPLPGETQWTIRFTVVDSGVDGQVEIMAGGIITPKV